MLFFVFFALVGGHYPAVVVAGRRAHPHDDLAALQPLQQLHPLVEEDAVDLFVRHLPEHLLDCESWVAQLG